MFLQKERQHSEEEGPLMYPCKKLEIAMLQTHAMACNNNIRNPQYSAKICCT